MFDKILIANRGEIACRVIKTARKMGVRTIAVFSDADRAALHVRMADEKVHIGPSPAAQSYILIDRILDAVRETGAQAVHPGYGFLSERAAFAEALEAMGVAFIGPPARAIEAMGDKIESKKLAAAAGVNTVPGFLGVVESEDHAIEIARGIGYPVMLKASAGGGGKGMRIAWTDAEVREGFVSSKNEAASSFGDDRLLVEKFVTNPRHIEIQVLGDRFGNCLWVNERECSIQRRNQKVIEEAPSPFLDPETRRAMGEQSVALAKAVDYCSAGTVEFIVDGARNFYFLEMNTRLQVEHPVTELITGIDLVEQMIRVAAGEKLSITQDDIGINGWAIESRLYAEDPYRKFLPSTGRLTRYRPPEEIATADMAVRNDTGVFEGGEISIFYDPMIAKLCTWGPDRASAIDHMRAALDAFEVEGIGHNLPFLAAVMDHPKFVSGDISTAFIAEEYPEGFQGAEISDESRARLAAIAVALRLIRDQRDADITGAVQNRARAVGVDRVAATEGGAWGVRWKDGHYRVTPLAEPRIGAGVDLDAGHALEIVTDWTPGDTLAHVTIDGEAIAVKVDSLTEGFRLRWRGADLKFTVRTPRIATLSALMPQKAPPDTSKMLLCPMPGLVVSIAVAEGQEVQDGQILCTVEAMKMENVLRAERQGVVSKINARPGDSMAVDEVIMEFE